VLRVFVPVRQAMCSEILQSAPETLIMTLAVTVDSQDHMVVLTGADALTVEDVLEARRLLVEDLRLPPGYVTLVDFRASSLAELRSTEVQRLAATRHELPFITVGSKVAVVVSSSDAFGIARMYELARPAAPEELRVFYDYDEARRWLGSRPWPGN
jgi:hypothetical protein